MQDILGQILAKIQSANELLAQATGELQAFKNGHLSSAPAQRVGIPSLHWKDKGLSNKGFFLYLNDYEIIDEPESAYLDLFRAHYYHCPTDTPLIQLICANVDFFWVYHVLKKIGTITGKDPRKMIPMHFALKNNLPFNPSSFKAKHSLIKKEEAKGKFPEHIKALIELFPEKELPIDYQNR